MNTVIKRIPLDRLVPHPDNPNRMSRTNFAKLVRNMDRTGRYEPLVVRPCPNRRGFFQIINGHRRCEALHKLGRTIAQVVVWNVNDEQTDVLVATLNRLGGRDTLDKKLTLLRRLCQRIPTRKLARLLPQTLGQIERLVSAGSGAAPVRKDVDRFAIPIVFFVDGEQQRKIEDAIATVAPSCEGQTRAARRAAALTQMAAKSVAHRRDDSGELPGKP